MLIETNKDDVAVALEQQVQLQLIVEGDKVPGLITQTGLLLKCNCSIILVGFYQHEVRVVRTEGSGAVNIYQQMFYYSGLVYLIAHEEDKCNRVAASPIRLQLKCSRIIGV